MKITTAAEHCSTPQEEDPAVGTKEALKGYRQHRRRRLDRDDIRLLTKQAWAQKAHQNCEVEKSMPAGSQPTGSLPDLGAICTSELGKTPGMEIFYAVTTTAEEVEAMASKILVTPFRISVGMERHVEGAEEVDYWIA